jgi:hypothetical protein
MPFNAVGELRRERGDNFESGCGASRSFGSAKRPRIAFNRDLFMPECTDRDRKLFQKATRGRVRTPKALRAKFSAATLRHARRSPPYSQGCLKRFVGIEQDCDRTFIH